MTKKMILSVGRAITIAAITFSGGGPSAFAESVDHATMTSPVHKRVVHRHVVENRRIDRDTRTGSIAGPQVGVPDRPVIAVPEQAAPHRGDYYTGPDRMHGFEWPAWPVPGGNIY